MENNTVELAKESYEKFRANWFSIPALTSWDELTEEGKQNVVNQYLAQVDTDNFKHISKCSVEDIRERLVLPQHPW